MGRAGEQKACRPSECPRRPSELEEPRHGALRTRQRPCSGRRRCPRHHAVPGPQARGSVVRAVRHCPTCFPLRLLAQRQAPPKTSPRVPAWKRLHHTIRVFAVDRGRGPVPSRGERAWSKRSAASWYGTRQPRGGARGRLTPTPSPNHTCTAPRLRLPRWSPAARPSARGPTTLAHAGTSVRARAWPGAYGHAAAGLADRPRGPRNGPVDAGAATAPRAKSARRLGASPARSDCTCGTAPPAPSRGVKAAAHGASPPASPCPLSPPPPDSRG